MSQETKMTNFRLPSRTLSQLDSVVASGDAKNRTDALILIIERYSNTNSQIQNNDVHGAITKFMSTQEGKSIVRDALIDILNVPQEIANKNNKNNASVIIDEIIE